MPDIETAHPSVRPRDLTKRHLTYRIAAMPADTNAGGDIFCGWLMAQVDIAGSVLAFEAATGRIATRAINEFQFLSPVLVGDLVSCYAFVTRVGNTSVQVHVEVEVERPLSPGDVVPVAEATLTYVALDAAGKPRSVPPLERTTDLSRQRDSR